MAKTKARKQREHQLRNKKRDVTSSRGTTVDFSTHERKTKTKLEKIRKHDTKHKKRFLQEYKHEGDAFFIVFFYRD
ncbi:hypothetical protein H1D32_16500 [Anaerobacillus sp. CMMVII]|uniref:hypothetical protein n=1 Tax=Anaerobacillus sp. CMMVII TaxID=2755588 RepID=UPI0021B776BD|nr:hypothetical protein [Anaerobacillus sp. CMMVII]MCT8139163.1 hypothetical protein [Anaerobacillus sp. CMMVII]